VVLIKPRAASDTSFSVLVTLVLLLRPHQELLVLLISSNFLTEPPRPSAISPIVPDILTPLAASSVDFEPNPKKLLLLPSCVPPAVKSPILPELTI